MSSAIETRPQRAIYNVGVALRLIEGVLDDLDRDLRPLRLGPSNRIVGHLMHALSLIEQLERPADSNGSSVSQRVRTELRGELETLLVDLTGHAAPAPVG